MAGKFLDNEGLARFKENMIQEVEARMGMPLGFEYFQTNPNVRAGSLPLTGGLYSRTTYSAFWAWIQEQDGYLITEAEWQAKAEANGGAVPFYSDGDGSTTFRVPALTVWVKGANGDEAVGDYLADTFASHKHNVSVSLSKDGAHTHERGSMNITGSFSSRGNGNGTYAGMITGGVGAFSFTQSANDAKAANYSVSNSGTNGNDRTTFDASKTWTGETSENGAHSHTVSLSESAQGGTETRPKTIIGMYCVIAFSAVVGAGVVNLEELQEAINDVEQAIANARDLMNYSNYGELRDRDTTKPTYGL